MNGKPGLSYETILLLWAALTVKSIKNRADDLKSVTRSSISAWEILLPTRSRERPVIGKHRHRTIPTRSNFGEAAPTLRNRVLIFL